MGEDVFHLGLRDIVPVDVGLAGAGVEVDVVVRRFAAGWRNFERVYKPLVDGWALYDNSGDAPILVEVGGRP